MNTIVPLRSTTESRMVYEGQANAGGQRRTDDNNKPYYDPAPLSEYPRMLYRKTDAEQYQEAADALGMKDERTVINRFDAKYLCETCIALSLTEAEALAELGWETSAAAAYGVVEGIGKAVSAKDDRIAELEALLAAREDAPVEKRGPGRPAKVPSDG